jgi:Tfp pilus assembly PilM family ATPase
MIEQNNKIKQVFNYLQTNEIYMSLSQIDFVKSLKKSFSRNKKLSEKQINSLSEIAKYLNVPETNSIK